MKKFVYILALLALLLLPVHTVFALNVTNPKDGRVVVGQNFTLKSGDTLAISWLSVGA
jgi:hypothetical protein